MENTMIRMLPVARHMLLWLGMAALPLAIAGAAESRAPAQEAFRAQKIAPPPGNTLFLKASAIGTQDYICLPAPKNPKRPDWSSNAHTQLSSRHRWESSSLFRPRIL
jgi:hypothetical protein